MRVIEADEEGDELRELVTEEGRRGGVGGGGEGEEGGAEQREVIGEGEASRMAFSRSSMEGKVGAEESGWRGRRRGKRGGRRRSWG